MNAILCWLTATSAWAVQAVVVFWPQATIIRRIFPHWPADIEYKAYLRGIAFSDVVFLQPLVFPTGIGLWRMRTWGLLGGVAVAGAAIHFGILQITAGVVSGSRYHLYGMAALGMPIADTPLFEWSKWMGLAAWGSFPALLGVSARGGAGGGAGARVIPHASRGRGEGAAGHGHFSRGSDRAQPSPPLRHVATVRTRPR